MKVSSTHIKPNTQAFNDCKELCEASANLYSVCIEYINKYEKDNESFKFTNPTGKGEYVFNYTHLYRVLKNTKEYSTFKHKDYTGRRINTKLLTQEYFQVNEAYTGWFSAIKSYKQDKSKFKSFPKQPNKKNKQNVVTVPNEAYSVKNNKLKISMTDIVINVSHLQGYDLREVQIIPCTYGYKVTVLYKDNETIIAPTKESKRICGIDLGVNNFNSLGFNVSDIRPFLINGKELKHINHCYNEKLNKLKSELPNGIKTSKKIKSITQKRNNRIDSRLHQISCYVSNFLKNNNIDTLVIGHNNNWKQNVNLGKNTNRKFCQLPFAKYIKLLTYKCISLGIKVVVREESYTSKCSFIDNESIEKHESYLGKRVKRGLFKTSSGIMINADINGALNIIRKQFNDSFDNPRIKYVSNIYKCIV